MHANEESVPALGSNQGSSGDQVARAMVDHRSKHSVKNESKSVRSRESRFSLLLPPPTTNHINTQQRHEPPMSRPIYIPRHKRGKNAEKSKKTEPAVSSVHSILHFEDEEEEVLLPKKKSSQQRQQFRVAAEAYMDEADYNEWAGPSTLQGDFETVEPRNIGAQLLAQWTTQHVPFVPLPTPKIDGAGLGFDRYADAPEFRSFGQRRQEGTAFYRAQDVVAGGAAEPEERMPVARMASGFALREDEDDVYDMVGSEKDDQYNTTAYDSNSDDEDNVGGSTGKKDNMFASWAAPEETTVRGVTSNGKEPPAGFVVGEPVTSGKRYEGPKVPASIPPHVFGPNDHPRVYQTLGRAVELQEQAKPIAAVPNPAMEHVANAIKNRFVSASTESTAPTSVPSEPTSLEVTRTEQSFVPNTLLCKRFNVPVRKVQVQPSSTATDPSNIAWFQKVFEEHQKTSKQTSPTLNPPTEKPHARRPEMSFYSSIFDSQQTRN